MRLSAMANAQESDVTETRVSSIGVVVHPTREIDEPLGILRDWTGAHEVELVQVDVPGREREVTRHGRAEDCDLLVSIGGDGTMLAATRTALEAGRPVLGVACGSLGALTSVATEELEPALDRFARGDWVPRALPGLDVERAAGEDVLALNDMAIVRAGQGQIRVAATVDGTLYGRFAGDGVVVSTALGSSAYALAAGGPLMAPGTDAFLLTPLSPHGGFCPPLVIGAASILELEIDTSHSGARVELDGQVTGLEVCDLRIGLRSEVATVVSFGDAETMLSGLRRRGIIIDSPRITAEDARR